MPKIMLDKQPLSPHPEREGGRAGSESRAERNSSGQASLAGQLLGIRTKQNVLAAVLARVLESLGDEDGRKVLLSHFPQCWKKPEAP